MWDVTQDWHWHRTGIGTSDKGEISPISLTTAAISPARSALKTLGFGKVGSGSSSETCRGEQGQDSCRETGTVEAQHPQDGAWTPAH